MHREGPTTDNPIQGAVDVLLGFQLSFFRTKRAKYTALSLVVFCLNLGLLLNDTQMFMQRQRIGVSRQYYSEVLQASHLVSLYWALMAVIYAVECGSTRESILAFTSIILNCVGLLGRLWLEMTLIPFQPESYGY